MSSSVLSWGIIEKRMLSRLPAMQNMVKMEKADALLTVLQSGKDKKGEAQQLRQFDRHRRVRPEKSERLFHFT